MVACADPAPIDGARCDAQRPCPDGWACLGERCRALPPGPGGCETDAHCPVGVCFVEVGFCVQCADDGDCLNGACLLDAWQCGCLEPGDCPSGRCHEPSATCLPCFDDRQCQPGWACDVAEGACKKIDDEGAQDEGTGDGQSDGDEEDG